MVIPLSGVGIGALNAAIIGGAEIILTGFMPSWSYEDRTDSGTGELIEKSELIFGLTDLTTSGIPTGLERPYLEITLAEAPAPGTWLLLVGGAAGLMRFAGRAGRNR